MISYDNRTLQNEPTPASKLKIKLSKYKMGNSLSGGNLYKKNLF